MGVVMTEQQVSIGLDRSDRRAGESMARALVGHRFRAVQQDIAVTVVDWPVVHAWSEDDPDFVGAVTVPDEAGAQLATTTGRPRPTWRRTGRRAGSGGSGSGR